MYKRKPPDRGLFHALMTLGSQIGALMSLKSFITSTVLNIADFMGGDNVNGWEVVSRILLIVLLSAWLIRDYRNKQKEKEKEKWSSCHLQRRRRARRKERTRR